MSSLEWRREGFFISTDPDRLDLDRMHAWLRTSYWAEDIPLEVLARAVAGSLCFGLYAAEGQIGMARIISDRATYAYLCDVFIDAEHRGHGLGKWLIASILSHPDLQGLRRFTLATRDAHGLYTPFGFQPLRAPDRHMEINRAGLYRRAGR